jgi:hypothetical protein
MIPASAIRSSDGKMLPSSLLDSATICAIFSD